MVALAGSFLAGVLTTLAPCVLPLLPVVVGGSVVGARDRRAGVRRALLVTASLGASVLAFTLLLRASTALIGVPPQVWSWVSGGLLVVLGLVMLFPAAWDSVAAAARLQGRSTARLSAAREREGTTGAVLTGAALGPVFTSCSPLYAYVVVTVLPAERGYGLALLVSYVVGLCGTLLAVALAGQRLVRRLGWLADPHGVVRRGLGLVFVAVGVIVALGLDRDLQAWILEHSPLRPWELDRGFIPEG
jgi:cytochrome c-type biogenesis protein